MSNEKRNREPPANGESQKSLPERKNKKPYNDKNERRKK